MPGFTPKTGGHFPARPLKYSQVISSLRKRLEPLRIYFLWRDIFGQERFDCPDPHALEIEFIRKVHAELFPLDDSQVSEVAYTGESFLRYGVPLRGWRVPWEVAALSDIEEFQQGVAFTLAANRDGEVEDWFSDVYGQPPFVWWLQPFATSEAWQAGCDWLAGQGSPWDGLAQMIDISLRNYANPFLGLPDSWFVEEYEIVNYDWEAGRIRLLREYWQEARPRIERIETFKKVFYERAAENFHYEVMDMLERSGEETLEEMDVKTKAAFAV